MVQLGLDRFVHWITFLTYHLENCLITTNSCLFAILCSLNHSMGNQEFDYWFTAGLHGYHASHVHLRYEELSISYCRLYRSGFWIWAPKKCILNIVNPLWFEFWNSIFFTSLVDAKDMVRREFLWIRCKYLLAPRLAFFLFFLLRCLFVLGTCPRATTYCAAGTGRIWNLLSDLKISSCECRAAVTQLNISVMSCEDFVIWAQKVWYFSVG